MDCLSRNLVSPLSGDFVESSGPRLIETARLEGSLFWTLLHTVTLPFHFLIALVHKTTKLRLCLEMFTAAHTMTCMVNYTLGIAIASIILSLHQRELKGFSIVHHPWHLNLADYEPHHPVLHWPKSCPTVTPASYEWGAPQAQTGIISGSKKLGYPIKNRRVIERYFDLTALDRFYSPVDKSRGCF